VKAGGGDKKKFLREFIIEIYYEIRILWRIFLPKWSWERDIFDSFVLPYLLIEIVIY